MARTKLTRRHGLVFVKCSAQVVCREPRPAEKTLIDKISIKAYDERAKKRTFFTCKRRFVVLAVKSMDVRDNFKNLCDRVFNGETLIISRPKNENIVMLSETEYNEMLKLKRNADYLAMLDKSMTEARTGGFIVKSVDELEDYE